MSKSNDIFVGIDLGTSRSTIATSDGERHMVESFVGWPVDMVARKLVKKDVLVGREALENRPMLDLNRPLERGLLKEGSNRDQNAVRELISHLVKAAGLDEKRSEGIKVRAVVGVPAEALRVNRQHLREAMRGHVDSLMIVSEPFAVAYGLDALLNAMVVDIGAGTTDACVMKGRYPTEEDQRTLPNAGDWIDEQLMKLLVERHDGLSVSIHTVRGWKENYGFIGQRDGAVNVTVPIGGKPTELDISAELKETCEALVPPVSETMIDLISSMESEYQDAVRSDIILAGGTSLIPGLQEALSKTLEPYGGSTIQVAEDPLYVGANGGLALALDAPKGDWEKLSS